MTLENAHKDVNFFLDELYRMLFVSNSPDYRNVFLRTTPGPTHKTLAAFVVIGPEKPDASNTQDPFALEALSRPAGARGVDFLSYATSKFINGTTIKEVALAEAGPGRWVRLVTSSRKADAIEKQNIFHDITASMGPAWGYDPGYIAIDQKELSKLLSEHFSRTEVRPDTIGYLAIKAAVHGFRFGTTPLTGQGVLR